MTVAAGVERDFDRTDAPWLARGGFRIGVITAIAVLLMSLVTRFTDGIIETVLKVVILAVGTYIVAFLPGTWTRARTIEGIAGAAAIGLAGTVVYLLIDVLPVVGLQAIGTYTNRWREIGGGSNWWYHPVWWMVGTFIPWMGAFMLSNQAARGGENAPRAAGLVAVLALVIGAVAILFGFPRAGWNVPTFGVAILPALALGALITGLGLRRE